MDCIATSIKDGNTYKVAHEADREILLLHLESVSEEGTVEIDGGDTDLQVVRSRPVPFLVTLAARPLEKCMKVSIKEFENVRS